MKKIREKFAEGLMVIPIPVYLIVVSVLNYIMGSLMADINKMYSTVNTTEKGVFFHKLILTISMWVIVMIANTLITKISNMKMLNKNYMKL